MDIRIFDALVKRSVGDTPGNFIEGYGALFNSRSVPELGFIEIIEPGSFDFAEMADVRMLDNHNPEKLLARTTNGTLQVYADKDGLFYRGNVANTSYGRDLLELVDRGDVTQSSFSFRIAPKGDDWSYDENGILMRHITKIDRVTDVSPTAFPAYTATRIDRRSYDQFMKGRDEQLHLEHYHRNISLTLLGLKMKM